MFTSGTEIAFQQLGRRFYKGGRAVKFGYGDGWSKSQARFASASRCVKPNSVQQSLLTRHIRRRLSWIAYHVEDHLHKLVQRLLSPYCSKLVYLLVVVWLSFQPELVCITKPIPLLANGVSGMWPVPGHF